MACPCAKLNNAYCKKHALMEKEFEFDHIALNEDDNEDDEAVVFMMMIGTKISEEYRIAHFCNVSIYSTVN
jgi:hypothetical protein